MNCPNCDSSNVDQSEIEDDVIEADSCHHTFRCDDCSCIFNIEYHSVCSTILSSD